MVEVLIPAYNADATLRKALASLSAQTDMNFKVAVIDDGSTQEYMNIIQEYWYKFPIRYIRLGSNHGCSGPALQEGLNTTDADYITILDADDLFTPIAIEMFNRYADLDCDYCIGYMYQQYRGGYRVLDETATTWHHGNLYKTDFLKRNKFEFPNEPNEDAVLNTWCMIMSKDKFIIPYPLYIWTYTEQSVTTKEDFFSIRNGSKIVKSYTKCYDNILKTTNKKDLSYTVTMMEAFAHSLAQFYNIYCGMLFTEIDDDEEELLREIRYFIKTFEIEKLALKNSLFITYFISSVHKTKVIENILIKITPEEFLAIFDVELGQLKNLDAKSRGINFNER